MESSPVKTDLVLLGGGHAHVEVIRRFGMKPEPGLRLTVISRDVQTPYSGMLPGLIAGHYSYDETHIDLAPLCQFAGARLYHDEALGLDLVTRRVLCRDRPPVGFDLLSIDTGSAPDTGVPGADIYATAVKPVSNFYARWTALHQRILDTDTTIKLAVVGGGAGGVELIMALRYRIRRDLLAQGSDPNRVSYCLVTQSDTPLPSHNRSVIARYQQHLEQAQIEVITGFAVSAVTAGQLCSRDGRSVDVDDTLWATTASAPAWPGAAGLATDEAGFIRVDACLQAVAWPGIFAAGDIAAVDPYPRPKSGVFAVRQGPPLAENLRRASRGEALKPHKPQSRFLALISTGDQHAVASRGRWSLAGGWVWRWKDWIDQRFMTRYRELPQMAPAATAGSDEDTLEQMRCGGCGSKIGAEVLSEALATLAPPARDDVVIGLEQADDAAVMRVPAGHLAVHSVDAFRSFIDDPWMLGRVAAIHALSDIYAMGATPQSALAMVTLAYAKPSIMRDDLVQLMSGALEVLNAEQTVLVGGHTGEGPELAVGFAINAYVIEQDLVKKRGVQAGDTLILTQALGSGVLFAGAMRGLASARMIDHALDSMTTSKANAARCFVEHQVHAMTDVTGFGLVGHLYEMLGDQALGAELELARLPLYEGVEQLVEQAVLSSLQAENRRAERHVFADPTLIQSPRYALAFDPQTAGGLLAAVPAHQAVACLQALQDCGYRDAVAIGTVSSGATGIRLLS